MKILRAEHLGMCFGVRDAIALAHKSVRQGPVTILGELVHNDTVVADLMARGVRLVHQPEQIKTQDVLITAHGTSQRMLDALEAKGLRVQEATCPLVHFAHRAVQELVRQGYHPIVIGRRDHVEVRGMTGDLAAFDVVLSKEDIAKLTERPRFGVVSQTTQPIERVRALVDNLRAQFPQSEVVFRDTVCQPTKQRQLAAVELGKQCDIVIVIGGANSNNTRELAATCGKHCQRVHHVTGPDDVCAEWFSPDDTVGITAGTSTPDSLIQAVENRIRQLALSTRAVSSPSQSNLTRALV